MVQLQRIADGVVFDVLGTKISGRGSLRFDGTGAKNADGDIVWMRYAVGTQLNADHGGIPYGFGNDYLRNNFTAYPPQERPRPLPVVEDAPRFAVRRTFCAYDMSETDEEQVIEAYAGARIVANVCPECGAAFSLSTLEEIKIRKD